MAMEILKSSLSASVFIMAVVIIRALALHRLPKRTFLTLWGIVLCRLLIPLSVPTRYSIFNLANVLVSHVSAADTTAAGMDFIRIGTAAQISTATAPNAASTISPFTVVWLIGLSACALFFLVAHLRCRREYKTALPVESEFVAIWMREHPIRRNVKILQSDRVAAPLTYGILRPVVLLPKGTDWSDEPKLQYILTHEFIHVRRFDILAKLLLAAAFCIHWFNPFVWVMYVLANRDIELSCDEAVVRTFGETIRSDYALTLIDLAEMKSRVSPLVNNFSKNAIEERIISIMKIKKASVTVIVAAALIVAGTTTVFATVARNNTANSDSGEDSALTAAVTSPAPSDAVYPAASELEAAKPSAEPISKDALPKYWDMGALNENGVPYLALASTAESLGYTVNVEKHDVKNAGYAPDYANVVEYNYELTKGGKSLGIASIDVSGDKVVTFMIDGIYCNTHDAASKSSIVMQDGVVYMPAQFFKEALDSKNILP